jgi:hypothetical protein
VESEVRTTRETHPHKKNNSQLLLLVLYKDTKGKWQQNNVGERERETYMLGSVMLMIIQGCKFWCLYKKQISYLLLQEGFLVNAIDLNVDDSEGDQDNGFDTLKDYASNNSNDA